MLQGQTYDQIAARFRVTKSTVSKSVADLARDLQSVVGVIGIDEDSAPTAHVIRAHAQDYLEALEHFVPLAKPARASDQRRATAASRACWLALDIPVHAPAAVAGSVVPMPGLPR